MKANAAAPERKMNWFLDLMLRHFQIFLWKLLMSTLSYSKHLKIAASDDNNSSSFLEGPLQRSLETLFSTHCLHSLLLTDNHLFFLQVWAADSWAAESDSEREGSIQSQKKTAKCMNKKIHWLRRQFSKWEISAPLHMALLVWFVSWPPVTAV